MATKQKKSSTAVTVWEQQMASAAAKQAQAEKPSGMFKQVSLRGGILSVDDTALPHNELRAVVLMGVPENQYYDGPYNPNVVQTPVCYAFGDPDADNPEDGMRPHEKSRTPQGDANGLCAACWANQMGSAEQGRGKACKNVRRLALVTEDALESAAALEDAETRALKLPVMSVKNWGKYVHKLADEIHRPSWGVITLIKVVPDAKSQFRVTFAFEELITFDQDLYDAMQTKLKPLSSEMTAPYPDLTEEAAAPKGRGGRSVSPASKKPKKY